MNNIGKTLNSLGITKWSLDFVPTTEEEFLEAFSIIVDEESENSRDPADFGVTWDQLVAESKMMNLRKRRNDMLTATDCITLKSYSMGEPVPANWAKYQQDLRDVTKTATGLDDVVWPTKPE